MAKDKISDYSSTANSNTDIAGINIDEGCAPSGINDAIRTLMAQLKTWQSGGQDVYITPAGSASAPSITTNGDTNTGIFFPAADTIAFSEGGVEAMRLNSSGNMGLGVTPSAWTTNYKAIQVGAAGAFWASATSGTTILSSNAYYDGTNYNYLLGTSNAATAYFQTSGQHRWLNAPNGTGAITFTQAMTLDASGNLGVAGQTAPSTPLTTGTWGNGLAVGTTSGTNGIVVVSSTSSSLSALRFGDGGGGAYDQGFINYDHSADALTLGTVRAERARIDSSGNLLVGTTTTSGITNGASSNAHNFLSFEGNINAQRNNGACFYASKASGYTNSEFHSFYVNGSGVGSITTTGSATAYNTSSDYRLKNITGAVTGAEAKDFIMSLQPKQGTWKSDGSKFVGFLAHEFQEVSPSSVTGEKDAVDSDGNPVMQAMQASSPEVIANLVALLQEQQAIITQLQADVAALKG